MPKKKSKRGDAMKKRWEVAKEAGMASLGDTSFVAAMEERDSDYEEAGTRTPAAFPLNLLRSSRARRLAALPVGAAARAARARAVRVRTHHGAAQPAVRAAPRQASLWSHPAPCVFPPPLSPARLFALRGGVGWRGR